MEELEQHLSFLTGKEGYDSCYSLSEFTGHLKADLSSDQPHVYRGWVFWRREGDEQPDSTSYKTDIKDKIKSVLHVASISPFGPMVQFWATKVDDGGHHYLTTSDQPFSVGTLRKGLCWYRKLCMDQRYYVGEIAKEEQLGGIGRVYRNKRPESTPDLRLYSTNEFPLRDFAARCGLRGYLAVPVFDLHNSECYGVLEVLTIDIGKETEQFLSLNQDLQAAGLRSTHTHFRPISFDDEKMPLKYKEQPKSELSKMLELAMKVVPQLHLAQVWVPCKQCANSSCFERATFIHWDETLNSCKNIDRDTFNYLQACEFHKLQRGCFRRNFCEISICENPLAHYEQKARLSLSFAVSLESMHTSNELYVIEFFLHPHSRKEASGGSSLHMLFRIMDMELKNFSKERQLADELEVQLSQPNAIQYESIDALMVMEPHRESLSESDFQEYLQTADLCCQRPSKKHQRGWVFCSPAREELSENDFDSNSSLVTNLFKEKLKNLMKKIACKWSSGSHGLVQFWAPKMEEERCCLATSDQPYALGCLNKGLALFREQCMKHHYFVDEGAKEEELGPPGRVFRNRHPEITPDLRLYSTREFSLRNHATHSCLQKYSALPVFDSCSHMLVGVLELVGLSFSTFGVIRKELGVLSSSLFVKSAYFMMINKYDMKTMFHSLQAANLSSTHINSEPSFLARYLPASITKCRKLALAEVDEALRLVPSIPQLYKAQVWVPCHGCAGINSNLSWMEDLALPECSRKFDFRKHYLNFRRRYFDSQQRYFDSRQRYFDSRQRYVHVETRKGIAGIVLASENKSCFFPNSCDFSITEHPLAHHQQRERLDACFAICLQSSHTGNLPYVLEFFLNQGPAKYGYLCSFLEFLLPIMRQNLKSFKVACGKQLGEELVVEVIEFSKPNELTFSELEQLESELQQRDIFPLKFKIVQYGQNERQHAKDQQMPYVSDVMDSVRSGAQAEESNIAADNSTKEDAVKKIEKGKGKTGLHLKLEDLKPHFGKRLKDVAEELCVGRSTIKRACRNCGIHRWPCKEKHKKNLSLFEIGSSSESARDSQQNTYLSSTYDLLLSDMSLHQNVPQANTDSTHHVIDFVQAEAENVMIKVKYKDDTLKFQLCVSSGMNKLVEKVAMRLNLKIGSFKLTYVDEDNDEILLACDEDLQLCLKSLGRTCVQLCVQLIDG